jgi:hypothetical protein
MIRAKLGGSVAVLDDTRDEENLVTANYRYGNKRWIGEGLERQDH